MLRGKTWANPGSGRSSSSFICKSFAIELCIYHPSTYCYSQRQFLVSSEKKPSASEEHMYSINTPTIRMSKLDGRLFSPSESFALLVARILPSEDRTLKTIQVTALGMISPRIKVHCPEKTKQAICNGRTTKAIDVKNLKKKHPWHSTSSPIDYPTTIVITATTSRYILLACSV